MDSNQMQMTLSIIIIRANIFRNPHFWVNLIDHKFYSVYLANIKFYSMGLNSKLDSKLFEYTSKLWLISS